MEPPKPGDESSEEQERSLSARYTTDPDAPKQVSWQKRASPSAKAEVAVGLLKTLYHVPGLRENMHKRVVTLIVQALNDCVLFEDELSEQDRDQVREWFRTHLESGAKP